MPESSLTRMRVCPKCGKPMRFSRTEPDMRFTNLDIVTFIYDCGENVSHFVARDDEASG